jgi:hypothetical protein
MALARNLLAGAAAGLLLAVPPARADLVLLHDGKTVEGKATLSSKKWTVKGYKGKSTTYAESEVKFREPGECTWDVAARMVKEIPADASDELFVAEHLKVARYLKERRVYAPETVELEMKEYEAVLKKAPDNEESHAGLGHIKWGQWWFKNEKDRDAFRKGDARSSNAVMEPLGYVRYKKTGMWESKEDIEAMEAGKTRFKGKWMTEDEKKAAQGYVKDEKGGWVLARDLTARKAIEDVEKQLGEKPTTVTSSRHFLLITWLNTGDTAQLKELFEKTYEDHRKLLGVPAPKEEEGDDDMFPEPITVYVLVDGNRKNKWVETYGKNMGWPPDLIDHRTKQGAGWHDAGPAPYMLSSGDPGEKNRARNEDGDMQVARSTHTSQIGRLILDRMRGGNHPAWLMEGNAFLAEIREAETADCCYASMTKYREQTADKRGTKARYYDFMKAQISNGLDRPLRQLFTLELNYLDWADAVKCWSFLEYLVFTYPDALHQMVKAPMVDVEEILPAHVEAAVKAMKPKDPAAALPGKPKDDGSLPTGPIKVSGPGAMAITEGSKEQRAVAGARSEAWISKFVGKDLDALETEWRLWIQKK